ncbi:MAG TPA: LPS assembly protein LptD, partial [Verrucomicrobiae bacterium]|nr:LPS assembly protein LptD [Verrucomicrobiae bacterium]
MSALALGLLPVLAAVAAAAPAVEVRVLSGPGAATTVTVAAEPGITITDRTPGAKPAGAPSGPASTGETFTGDITLFLSGLTVPRPAAIEVADPVVSTVRLFPEPGGAVVTVFVRQPVTYSVSRPSALGEVRIEVRTKTRPLTVVGVTPRGRPRIKKPTPTGENEVAVDAESLAYDQASNTLTAHGGVTLTRGDTTLTADEVVFDRTNQVAEARGHVVVSDPEATVQGDFAHLNLDDESGWIENADADMHPSDYVLRAGRLDKKGGPQYSVANGVFTTCQCGGLERPSWSIAGRQTDVTLQGEGIVHHMTFRVKDVPVFYFPYFVFPANTQRESGFLIPRLSYSSRRGFQYEQPFFWAISKSSDATIATDLESALRVGIIGEYRYMLSREARGGFTFAYYNESIRSSSSKQGIIAPNNLPVDIPVDRFAIVGHHFSPFVGGSKFYLDMFAVSDEVFLQEINNFAFSTSDDLGLRSTRYTTSRTGLLKTWGEGYAAVESAYYQDLIDPQEVALQKLPRLEAEHSLPLLGDRLVAHLAGQAIDYQRDQGYDGVRADLAPDLMLPFHLGRVLHGSLTGQVRETAYHLTNVDQVARVVPTAGGTLAAGVLPFRTAPELPHLDTDHSRELGEIHGQVGTELARVFTFRHLGLEKLRHTIEPELQYLFVPQVGRPIFDKSLPCKRNRLGQLFPGESPGVNCDISLFSEGYLFDDRDAINRRNFVSYGFTTRLLGRGPTAAESSAATAGPAPAAPAPVDPETLPQGLSAGALPDFVGPPPPAAPGAAPPAATAPRELVRASILHGYDISRPLVGDSHASDIDVGVRVAPLDYLGLTYNTTVGIEQREIRGLSTGLFLREPWYTPPSVVRNFQSPTTVGISYRFIQNDVNRSTPAPASESPLQISSGVNEIDGSFYLRLGDYLGFTFLSRYDLSTSTLATSTGGTSTLGPHFL